MNVITIINLHQGFFLTKFGNQSATFTTFNLWWSLTFIKVIIIINLHQGFFWLSLVAIAHSFRIWPLMTFDLHEGHHHHKLASGILLTKFGCHSTLFTTFDLWWPLTSMKVIIIINSHQGFFWPSLVAIARVFFPGGTGGFPPSGENFANSPTSDTCPRFWTKACPPPQPRFVPENLKNSSTFLCQIWLLLSSKVP